MREFFLLRAPDVRRAILSTLVIGVPVAFLRIAYDPFNVPKLTLLMIGVPLVAALRIGEILHGRSATNLRRVAIPGAALLTPLVAAWVLSPYRDFALFGHFHRFQGLAPYVLVVAFGVLLADAFAEDTGMLARAFIWSGGVVGAYTLVQVIGLDPFEWNVFGTTNVVTSTIGNSNFVGGYLGIVLPVAVGYAIADRDHRRRTIYLGLAIVGGWLAARSQGGWLAGIGGLSVVAGFYLARRWKLAGYTGIGSRTCVVGVADLGDILAATGMVSAPIRVARVITRLNIGGPARQALLLTRELASQFPTVLIAGTPPPEEGELVDPAVQVTRVPLVRPIRPATDARAFSRIRKLFAQHRPPIVHTHMAKAGAIGRLAASRRSDVRTVHTFHGHVLEGYFSKPVQRAFIELERRLARRTDVLIAVSDEIRDELLELRIGHPDQYRVIPLGLDLDPFLEIERPAGTLRVQLGLEPSTQLIGIVGRLVPIKDVGITIDAVARLDGVHLAVIGDGEVRHDLERNVEERRLSDRIHFTGWAPDVVSVMSDLDVVVLSSRNEGTPVSLIEAHAAGKAVVATDVGGVRSVVRERETGFLVAAGDAAALARQVETLLRDPELRSSMGAKGRAHVRDRFGKERLIRDIKDLYEDLLRASR